MRTREEQISELVVALKKPVCRPDYPVSILEAWLEHHILEAERRAEQRVRAEIARDSERLDWLENTRSVVLQDADNGWRVTIGGVEFSLMEETARNAIDAAREVG